MIEYYDMQTPRLLWEPTQEMKENANLSQYMQWLSANKDIDFSDYHALWKWSTTEIAEFWQSLWEYFDIQFSGSYTSITNAESMPHTRWFEGSQINYAEHIFRAASDTHPALLFQSERHALRAISWQELRLHVTCFAAYLSEQGVKAGDRIVAYLPTIPEATIAFLATASLGAVWSSCSPDFGADSVIDRFQQIEPKIIIAVDGYAYGGKLHDKRAVVQRICENLPSLTQIVWIPYMDFDAVPPDLPKAVTEWSAIMQDVTYQASELHFKRVPFNHPIWVLYSSGTTGIPKAITHSQGGVLLEHLKYMDLHNDVRAGERFYWYTTTGWMMWNFLNASLLVGATAVLYDGSPGYPNLNVLWKLCEQAGIHHFGTSAPFIVACMKEGLQPGQSNDLFALRSIGSTGSPLPPEAFDYVYRQIKNDVWLCSMSGGTDVCTAFVGSCPLWPVYEGEIQCRALGCALYAYDEDGQRVTEAVGEMVIEHPMPSMPIFFWNDEEKSRYKDSYFSAYSGIWRHGDWIRISPRHSLVILGRSDATLNRQGVRIGTAEIYRALNSIPSIQDALIVNIERDGGEHFMPLFVKLKSETSLSPELQKDIRTQLRTHCSPRHVPDAIYAIPDIPYTISGKKMEAPVKKIMMGVAVEKVVKRDSMRNPEALAFFQSFELPER